jgi:hypothetical protein
MLGFSLRGGAVTAAPPPNLLPWPHLHRELERQTHPSSLGRATSYGFLGIIQRIEHDLIAL